MVGSLSRQPHLPSSTGAERDPEPTFLSVPSQEGRFLPPASPVNEARIATPGGIRCTHFSDLCVRDWRGWGVGPTGHGRREGGGV